MKTVDIVEASANAVVLLTRRQKLERWASLIRTSKWPDMHIFHLLERWDAGMLKNPFLDKGEANAFSVALGDPQLAEAGYTGKSMQDAMNFFELSQAELHEFSCDCGGNISNKEMASRIEKIARGSGLNGLLGTAMAMVQHIF